MVADRSGIDCMKEYALLRLDQPPNLLGGSAFCYLDLWGESFDPGASDCAAVAIEELLAEGTITVVATDSFSGIKYYGLTQEA